MATVTIDDYAHSIPSTFFAAQQLISTEDNINNNNS